VPDLLEQPRVAGRAEADVVREDRRALQVAVAVDRVHAVQDRDAEPGLQGRRLVAVDHVGPRLRRVAGRDRAAPGEDAAERVGGDQRRIRVDVDPFGLGHLPDLLGQGHPAQQVVDPLVDREVAVPVRRIGRSRLFRRAVRRGLAGRLEQPDGQDGGDGGAHEGSA
jgi:hypothetical protein